MKARSGARRTCGGTPASAERDDSMSSAEQGLAQALTNEAARQWLGKGYWTPDQGVLLVYGLNPDSISYNFPGFVPEIDSDSELSGTIRDALGLVHAAIAIDDLNPDYSNLEGVEGEPERDLRFGFIPLTFLTWAGINLTEDMPKVFADFRDEQEEYQRQVEQDNAPEEQERHRQQEAKKRLFRFASAVATGSWVLTDACLMLAQDSPFPLNPTQPHVRAIFISRPPSQSHRLSVDPARIYDLALAAIRAKDLKHQDRRTLPDGQEVYWISPVAFVEWADQQGARVPPLPDVLQRWRDGEALESLNLTSWETVGKRLNAAIAGHEPDLEERHWIRVPSPWAKQSIEQVEEKAADQDSELGWKNVAIRRVDDGHVRIELGGGKNVEVSKTELGLPLRAWGALYRFILNKGNVKCGQGGNFARGVSELNRALREWGVGHGLHDIKPIETVGKGKNLHWRPLFLPSTKEPKQS